VNKFILQLIAITLITGVTYFFIGQSLPAKFFFESYMIILFLFFIVTLLFHIGLQKSFEKSSKDFIRYYMGATGAKLFVFLIIILIYAFLNKEKAVSFALTFFFFYLIFTVFEVSIATKLFGKHAAEFKAKQKNDQDTLQN
jgi:hypothetical protein